MKNFFKKIHFGAVAVLMGLALILTQSAFKSNKAVDYWFTYDHTSGTYVQTSEENIPANCDLPDADILCAIGLSSSKVDFSGPTPQPNSTVQASPETQSDATLYRDEN
jgi:hypothetical protein